MTIETTFAGRTPHHQGAKLHEVRPPPANGNGDVLYDVRGPREQVLIEKKNGLNGIDFVRSVFEDEISIVKSLPNGVFDKLVIATVLAIVTKYVLPMPDVGKVGFGHEFRRSSEAVLAKSVVA